MAAAARSLRLVTLLVLILTALPADAGATARYSAYGIRQGEQRIGVVLLDLDWSPRPELVTTAEILLFGDDRQPYSVQQYFAAVSGGAIQFAFDVFGPFSVGGDAWCRHTAIVAAGSAALLQAGGDPFHYDAMLYITEEAPAGDCQHHDESFQGDYRASTNSLVLYGHLSASLIVHELGHELGLAHAHGYACLGSPPLTESCAIDPYGDPTDLMGHPWPLNMFYGFNAPHRIAMGLIGERHLKTLRRAGTYTLLGSGVAKPGTHILAIPVSGGVLGEETVVFVEYRQPLAAVRTLMPSEMVVTAWAMGGDQPTYYLGRLRCLPSGCESFTLHQGPQTVTITALYQGPAQARVRVDVHHTTASAAATLLVTRGPDSASTG